MEGETRLSEEKVYSFKECKHPDKNLKGKINKPINQIGT